MRFPSYLKFLLMAVLALSIPLTLFAEEVDRVVAVVNEEPITLYELDKLMATKIDEIQKIDSGKEKKKNFNKYRSLAIKSLVDERLLDQELKRRNIQITPEDEEKAMQNVLERNKLTQEQLVKELAAKGMTVEDYKVDLRDQLKRIKFMGAVIAPRVKVTDADLDEFFAQNSEKFADFQSVEIAQIIMSLSVGATDQQIAQVKGQAEEVIKKARGGANFSDLGRKYSITPQTAEPAIYQLNQLAPQIANALSTLKQGEISDPVRSTMGLHVVKLYTRKTLAGEEYKVIREQIRERVFEVKLQEQLEEYLDDLRTQSYVEVKA